MMMMIIIILKQWPGSRRLQGYKFTTVSHIVVLIGTNRLKALFENDFILRIQGYNTEIRTHASHVPLLMHHHKKNAVYLITSCFQRITKVVMYTKPKHDFISGYSNRMFLSLNNEGLGICSLAIFLHGN